MLAVSPFRNPKNERENEMEGFAMDVTEFPDCLSTGNLLDSIDFDDLFAGMDGGDMLPGLDMDHEILAEFSLSAAVEESSEPKIPSSGSDVKLQDELNGSYKDEKAAVSVSGSGSVSDLGWVRSSSPVGETVDKPVGVLKNPSTKRLDRGRKSTASNSKNTPGKKKVKVDWTPDLHRRFVQAVEQLGLDKAVPSRILEVMGIDCLTRHHIASHLQKYRSHRKHLLAREAEAASWGSRRQAHGGSGKGDVGPWIAPTMGFPQVTPPAIAQFRPLHVWGHPSVDQSLVHTWPKHLTPPPPHAWPPAPPPPIDPSFWIPHHHHVPTSGTPCFPPHMTPPVAGIPPPVVYKVEPTMAQRQELPQPPADVHPSKESVDAAIGDVLSKPWLPLPLGLKPPLVDGVMVELQRQGISKVPPTCLTESY